MRLCMPTAKFSNAVHLHRIQTKLKSLANIVSETRKMENIKFLSGFLLAVLLVNPVYSANILFYHQVASYSHQVSTYPLADALAARGHDVTYIAPFHHKGPRPLHPNITMIVPEKLRLAIDAFLDADFDIKFRVEKKFPRLVDQFYPIAVTACEIILNSPELKEFMEKTTKLDLMILDNCMTECGLAIAYKYGAKHILFNTVTRIPNEYDQYGYNGEYSAIPELEINPPQTPMAFLERVLNTLIPIHFRYVQYTYQQDIDKLVRNYLKDPTMPHIDDLARNFSLAFHSADVITDYPRTHPPNVIDVGGMHCELGQAKVIPDNIKNVIEDPSSDGFIYISFGSLVKPEQLPDTVRQVFFDTAEAYPKLRFLWKWTGPVPKAGVPKNMHLAKWFPQMDLLGHPKIKGFVTQGGKPSTMEAFCNAVPMIAFPVLGDQDINSNRMNKMGVNVKLELASVTREELKGAVIQVAYDTRMKERIIELRNIMHDQPIPPLQKAVWWTEYVLRSKDTAHLKPAGFDQWWYQRRLLDVWAFLFLIITTVVISLTMITLYILRKIVFPKKINKKFKSN